MPTIGIDGQQIWANTYGKPVNLEGVNFWFDWAPLGAHSQGEGMYMCDIDLWAEGKQEVYIEAYWEKRMKADWEQKGREM